VGVIASLVSWFVGLGATVMVPVVIIILGICFRAGVAKSIRGGLITGIGLAGLFMVVDVIIGALQPATAAIAQRLGLQLTLVDVGWTDCGIAWGWPGVAAVVVGTLIVNAIMIALRLTKTLWTDIWSIWHGQVVAAFIWAATGNMMMGVAGGVLFLALGSIAADLAAPHHQEFNNLPGIGVPCTVTWVGVIMNPVAGLLRKIPGIKDVDASPDSVKKKFGLFGELPVMGAVMGIVIGLLAGYKLADLLGLAMKVATMMVLLPRMVSLLSEGLIPISISVSEYLQERFGNRQFNVGVDCAALLGHPSVMASAVILYPLTVLLAAALPGNGILPIASLALIPFWCGAVVPYTRGNVLHTVIIVLLWSIPVMYIATAQAGIHTETFKLMGQFTDKIQQGARFASFDMGGDVVGAIIIKLFTLFK
jgi:PTS system galactitol-specific IIC component